LLASVAAPAAALDVLTFSAHMVVDAAFDFLTSSFLFMKFTLIIIINYLLLKI